MDKLQVVLVIEIMGRPADHVKEALNTLVVKLGSEKGVKLLEKKYNDPVPIKDSDDLFTAFAEVTAELENMGNYFGIIFGYMPSHIEIINPEKFSLSNFDLNDLGNKLIARLHSYDAIAKNVVAERNFLLERVKVLDPELYKKITTPPQIPNKDEKPKKGNKSKKTKKKTKKN